ncbi:hypothetical protein CcCBS67573_g00127 [Chytriomyces confervae]|uniref:LCCL domain-containing protein n=1 Tax=Chytriomyces confervae TaxID=246404 RepID=A0A507FQQ9_9FUNG|nr:hypothetical protein CcCBS67573_g00127 [Chytriomyces confervae]
MSSSHRISPSPSAECSPMSNPLEMEAARASEEQAVPSIPNEPILEKCVTLLRKARSVFQSRNPKYTEYTPISVRLTANPIAAVLPKSRDSRSDSNDTLDGAPTFAWKHLKHPAVHFLYTAIIVTALVLFTRFSSYSATVSNYGAVQTASCAAAFMSETGCGNLNSADCEPFDQSIAIRCPAGCVSQLAWNFLYVGPSAVQYVPFVVGSSNTYRGDSWICSAAIHAGVLSNSKGGCVVAKLSPSQSETYQASSANGIASVAFNSSYPSTLSFESLKESDTAFCADLGFVSEGFFVPFLMLFPLLNVSRKHLFWNTLIWIFLYWTFVSPDTSRADDKIAKYLASLLPAIAVLYCLYVHIVRYTMPKPNKYPLESILWVGFIWLGFHLDMLSNYGNGLPTLSFSANNFKNSAQLPALIVIICVVLLLGLNFTYWHWKQNTMFPLVVFYVVYFTVYFSLPKIVGLSIHVHHYIFSLLLLPFTRLRLRLALFSQALLLGLMLQGVLKFGFASPFDTHLQAGAIYTQGTTQALWNLTSTAVKSAPFTTNTSATLSDMVVEWVYPLNRTLNVTDLDTATLMRVLGVKTAAEVSQLVPINEYSLTVNDVQIYRGKQARFSFGAVSLLANGTSARRVPNMDSVVAPFDRVRMLGGPFYLRVAPVRYGNVLDYGKVAVVDFRSGDITYVNAFSN